MICTSRYWEGNCRPAAVMHGSTSFVINDVRLVLYVCETASSFCMTGSDCCYDMTLRINLLS